MHRWIRNDETGEWNIYCEKEAKSFSCRMKEFRENGRCIFCGENAKKELDERKRKREEYSQKKEDEQRELTKGTLANWF